MSEMIERVARALFAFEEHRWPSDEGEPEGDLITWEENVQQAEYLDQARAAIEAMRVPTQEQYDSLTAKDMMWRELNSTDVYVAMIDGALK